MNISDYCSHFYSFSGIPVYYYEKRELIFSFSLDPDRIRAFADVTEKLLDDTVESDIYETAVSSYYGRIRTRDGGILILGPVRQNAYSEEDLRKFRFTYQIRQEDWTSWQAQLKRIPACPLLKFYHLLSCLQMTLGQENTAIDAYHNLDEQVSLDDFIWEKPKEYDAGIRVNIIEQSRMFEPFIREGNFEGLIAQSNRNQEFYLGEYSKEHRINKIIGMVLSLAFSMRAAVDGGMPETEAYLLIRKHIVQALKARTAAEVDEISMRASMELVEHMREFKDTSYRHSSVYDCVNYIRSNIYSPIKVRDVVAYSGYTAEHFSRLFKKETGFGAQEFIYNCKLLEAKNLLTVTDMPVGQISEALCFSSQSHFQNRFRKKFGMTPLEYRRKNK